MIDKLKKEFLEVYYSNISTTKGLIELAENIGISKNSLRRFIGKLKDDTRLRISTLNLISETLGYKNYKHFCETFEDKTLTLDFELLEIFYDAVKGKGTSMNEPQFLVANHYFAKKIVENPSNLKEFVKRFSQNEEALEYVIAWHPSYEKIANEDYQNILMHLAKNCKQAHIKVFAFSFIYFGKFISGKMMEIEANKLINKIEKNVIKMRRENLNYHAFPEARYFVAKSIHQTIFYSKYKVEPKNARLVTSSIQNSSEKDYNVNQIVFDIYVSDCYLILQKFSEAEIIINKYNNTDLLMDFEKDHPFLKAHIHLLKINFGLILFNIGQKSDALLIFNSSNYIHETRYHSFDSRIYFEIKYYMLGKHLFPNRIDLREKFEELIQKSGLSYLRNL